jgi:dipeptidyl aminopeptidase/acylaminoacyl peptidase
MGAEHRSDEALAALSPLTHATEVRIPVLLIHGRDDTVVPIDQSRLMAQALQRAGKPVKLVELKGEDHWLSLEETRLRTLIETVAFLEANNPPN